MNLGRQFLDTVIDLWNQFFELIPRLSIGLFIIIVFVIIGRLAKMVLKRRLLRRNKDAMVAAFTGDILKWTFYILGAVAALKMMGFGGVVASIMAGAGISAIVFGFAFKDIAENFLAGILLALNRPFSTADLIEVGGHKGTVRKLEIRTTHIRVADGRDIFVPNAIIMKSVVTNFTRDGLQRLEFIVGVDPEIDLDFVRKIIMDQLSKEDDVLDTPAPSVIVDELATSTVNFKVMFWIDTFQQREKGPEQSGENARSRVMRVVRDVLIENQVGMPANIVEHKMFRPDESFQFKMLAEKPTGTEGGT